MVISEEREGGRGKVGVGDSEVQTTMYKISKLQRCIVYHRDYSQYFYHNYKWNITFKYCESLHCVRETYIILYINYISINK